MAKQWYVAQSVRNREIAAALSVVQYGLEAYLPVIQTYRRIGRKLVEASVPRFGVYIFVRFDRETDPWPELCREPVHRQRYFRSILCNAGGQPSPVPDQAMEAIKAYKPPSEVPVEPIIYRPGQRVTWCKAGVRREAVFVGYAGRRQFVQTWIFGAERVTEVCEAELEPLDLDIAVDLTTACAT